MEIKITKKQKLLEINNEMCHNYYYLVHGRIYNDDKTAYRKFKFISWFDIFDVDEYFNGDDGDDPITKEMIMEYLDECIWATITMIKDYDDEVSLKYFYDICNESIIRYNEIARFW